MEKFIQDMIHMTEGEKLVNYWWLYLLICAIIAALVFAVAMIPDPYPNMRRRKKP